MHASNILCQPANSAHTVDLVHLQTLQDADDFPALEQAARIALKAHPDHPRLRQFLGVALFKQERSLEEAIAHLRAASDANPADPNALNQYALALKTAKRFDDAHEVWRQALQLAPDHPALLSIRRTAPTASPKS